MPTEVIMPKVDMDMDKGRISAWHVGEGDAVKMGDPLFDIETDKAAMEVESPADGRLGSIAAAVGDDVPIGQTIAWVYADGEEIVASQEKAIEDDASDDRTASDPESGDRDPAPRLTTTPREPGEPARATPLARRLARQHGIPLDAVKGTGPSGRISRADIEAHLDSSARIEPPADSDAAGPKASGEPLAVHRSGGGDDAPLVFLHGLTGDSDTWNKLVRRIGGDRPILRIDLPSHGRSPREAVEEFEALVDRMVAAFDAVGLKRAHLVGHSLGGAIAIVLADRRPRDVASLTLLSPAGLGPEIDADTLHGIARASRAESLAPWLKRLVHDPERIGWDYVKAAMASRADEDLRMAQTRLVATLLPDATQSFDIAATLARVQAPTRIVWGREDGIIPWRHALRAPGRAGLHLVPSVGHLPHMEAVDVVAHVIAEQTGSAP